MVVILTFYEIFIMFVIIPIQCINVNCFRKIVYVYTCGYLNNHLGIRGSWIYYFD